MEGFFCFCHSSSLIHGYILYDRASSYIINDPDIPGLAWQKKIIRNKAIKFTLIDNQCKLFTSTLSATDWIGPSE